MQQLIRNIPFLSILIPTRNRAQYLKFAIESALNIKYTDVTDIEIIVSENHSQDNSLHICNSFTDPRLTIVRPPNPLAMHENWEFLLNLSKGKWVTFIGDDDAVMPHCLEHLLWLETNYPKAEAIVSPRNYYFWNGCQKEYGDTAVSIAFCNEHFWLDSKKQLNSALRGKVSYMDLPQMYSGGFHRRSLVNRVLNSQCGVYFKSVTPDAYTAVMGCLHTYRYLQTKIPMTWVGSSPHKAISKDKSIVKDRVDDFWGMHSTSSLAVHFALGDLREGTFLLYLYEAYISAFPLTNPEMLSLQRVKSVFCESVRQLRTRGREDIVLKLSQDLGFDIPVRDEEKAYWFIIQIFSKLIWITLRLKYRFLLLIDLLFRNKHLSKSSFSYSSNSHKKHPHILSCDKILTENYYQCINNLSYGLIDEE